jgi:hypothetical protein
LWAGPQPSAHTGPEVALFGGQDVDDTTGIRLGGTGRIKLGGDPPGDSARGRLTILNDGANINVTADAIGPGPRLIDGLGELWNNEMEDGTKKFIIHDDVTVSGDMIISAPMDLHGGLILAETIADTISLRMSAKSSGTAAHTGVYRVLDGDLIVGSSTGNPAELMLVSGPAPWELDRGQIRIEAFADCRLISGPLIVSGQFGGGKFYAFANWWTTQPATISVDLEILVNEPTFPTEVRVKGVTIRGTNQVTVTKIGTHAFKTY